MQAVKYHSTVTVTPTIENLGRSENGKMKIIKQQKRKEEKKRKKKKRWEGQTVKELIK